MRTYGRSRVCLALVAALAAALSDITSSQEFAILYHEHLPELVFGAQSAAAAAAKPQTVAPPLSFVAFGRQFDLALTENDTLIRGLPPEQLEALRDVELYRGELAGVPGSWVRLTRYAGTASGLIWDGEDLYGIDPLRDAAPFLSTPDDADPATPIIYRWSEMIGVLTDRYAPSPSLAPSGGYAAEADSAAKLSMPALLSPAKQLDIGFVADYEFVSSAPADVESRLLAIANNVDAIMIRDLGLHLRVGALERFDSDTDPFTTNDPAGLLGQMESHKLAAPALRSQALAHLFTARNLAEPSSSGGQIVGFANLGVVCNEQHGVAVTQATFGVSISSLIAAHEIGHNLGAPHDGEQGSACAATPRFFLMAPEYNGSETFSDCSIEQIEPYVAAAACLGDILPNDVSVRRLRDPGEVLLGDSFDVRIAVDSNGTENALGIELRFDGVGTQVTQVWPDTNVDGSFRCDYSSQTSSPICGMGPLAGGESYALTIQALATEPGPMQLDAVVSAINDLDPSNNTESFDIDVLPSVDLGIVSGEAVPPIVRPGDLIRFEIDLQNFGLMTATGVIAELTLPTQTEFVAATISSGGTCVETPDGFAFACSIGALRPDELQTIELTVRAFDPGLEPGGAYFSSLRIGMSANERDLNGYNDAFIMVGITPVIANYVLSLTGPDEAAEGSAVAFTLVVENMGPDLIPSADLDYSNLGMSIDAVNAGGGTCDVDLEFSQVHCALGELAPNETRTVVVSGIAPDAGSFSAGAALFAAAYSTEPFVTMRNLQWSVSAPPSPPPSSAPPSPSPPPPSPPRAGGGGGGGSIGFAWLPILASAWLMRERRRGSRHRQCRLKRLLQYVAGRSRLPRIGIGRSASTA